MTVSELGERALIERIRARLSLPSWVVIGPGDDAAVIEPARGALEVVTTDALVEGVHFDRRFVPPDAIGHRALAVNLSDLAAMGAEPRAALLSFMLPDGYRVTEMDGVLDGLLSLAAEHRVAVVGGNITRSPGPLVIDVTAMGSVGRRRVLTRAGARPGDEVYVTGSLGEAVAGLQALRTGEASGVNAARYLRPQPRVRAGMMLARHRAASACMDLSDGFADAVTQVADASGVGITIDAEALPIPDHVREWFAARGEDPVSAALAGGDDYELLFCVRPSQRGRLRGAQRLMRGLPVTRVGVVTKERGVTLRTADGTKPMPAGYEHFARPAGESRL